LIVVTVPAYNESRFLEKCVEKLLAETSLLNDDFRIVIAEDGSTDGTDEIARNLELLHPRVVHLHSYKRLGRGAALKNAWNKVKGDVYLFVDCDLATDMMYYPRLIGAIMEGHDLAIGSRHVAGATVRRPLLRELASRVYNLLVRVMFRDGVRDHQLGFKAFSSQLITDLLEKCESNDWFWDTEIIVRSVRYGYRWLEFPVEWEEKKTKKTRIKRLIEDMYIHGTGLLKLRARLSQ